MSGVDWLILGTVLLSVVLAASQGFVFEAFSLAGVVGGYVVAAWEYSRVASFYAPYVKTPWMADAAGFLTIFFCIVLLAGIVGRIARAGAKAVGLRWFDRVLGAAFGLVRGVLIVTVLLLAAASWGPASQWLSQSQIAPYMLIVARAAVWVAPAQVRMQFREGMAKLRDMRTTMPSSPAR